MPGDGQAPDYLDDTHRAIAEFADAFLDEDERADFVDGLLERHGYRRESRWAPPDASGGGQGGGRQPLLKNRPQPRGGNSGGGGGGQSRQGGYWGGRR